MKFNRIEGISIVQQVKIDLYVEKWVQVASQAKLDEEDKVIRAIHFFYEKILMQNAPERILFLDSEKDCQLVLQNVGKVLPPPTHRFKLIYRKLERELEKNIWSTAVLIYAKFYHRFHTLFNETAPSDLSLQYDLEKKGLQHFSPTWSKAWNDLYRYGFYDFLLQEVFPDKSSKFHLFQEWIEHLPHLNRCWLSKKTAVICRSSSSASETQFERNLPTKIKLHTPS